MQLHEWQPVLSTAFSCLLSLMYSAAAAAPRPLRRSPVATAAAAAAAAAAALAAGSSLCAVLCRVWPPVQAATGLAVILL